MKKKTLKFFTINYIFFAVVNLFLNIPIINSRIDSLEINSTYLVFSFSLELTTFVVFNFLFFNLLSYLKYFGKYFSIIILFCSLVINHFVSKLNKIFDTGVLADMVEVDIGQIGEFMGFFLILKIIILASFFVFIIKQDFITKHQKKLSAIVVTISLLIITPLLYEFNDEFFENGFANKATIQKYPPFSIIYATTEYRKQIKLQNNFTVKIEDLYKYSESEKNDDLNVILIVGESTRYDFLAKLLRKKNKKFQLSKEENLISFKNFTSCSTSTRESIPCMITRSKSPNWNEKINETSIISIFKKLGYKTAWIGTQSVRGVYASSFTKYVYNTDYTITKKHLKSISPTGILYDNLLLKYINVFLEDNKNHKKKFIIFNPQGSHWHIEQRYPEKFRTLTPVCSNNDPKRCSKTELFNSYQNAATYSDFVYAKIIDDFRAKNTLLIFSSDHGISLGENNYYGSSYRSANKKILDKQKDVSTFIWYSNKFKAKYKSIAEKINKSRDRKLNHDYIFHSILGCSSINSKIIEKNLNICS